MVPAADTAHHNDTNAGHHHILVDSGPVQSGTIIEPDDIPPDDPDFVPENRKRYHFGLAQTEAAIYLPAGTHKLTMQFADFEHRSYGPELSKTITVTVVEK